MEIKTLTGTPKKEILNVFNDSFSDYFIPFKLTEEQLISKMLVDKTDLGLSVGVFEKGKLIAFILHGFDTIATQKVVYNGGTGVIAEKRGSGLTQQMYRFIIPLLQKKGINKLKLEVITENIQAIKAYKASGFTITRALSCYKGDIEILNTNRTVEIRTFQNYNWGVMESFWDIHPTWQNAKGVINTSKSAVIAMGAYIEKRLVGYVIYYPKNKRIQQIAVHKDFRKRRIASALIFELKNVYGKTFSIINVDKRAKAVNDFFRNVGLQNNLEQFEMELKLNQNSP